MNLKSRAAFSRTVCLLTTLLYPALSLADEKAEKPPTFVNHTSPLGINTNEAMEVNASLPFVDVFRLALPFESARPWLTKGKINYDKNGWPTHLNGGQVGTRFLSHIPKNALPKGVYTVRYDGEGKLRYGGSVKLIKRLPGKDLIRFKPLADDTITATLFIDKSNPKDHVRNIRVLMSGGICLNNPFKRVENAKECGKRTFLSFADHHSQILFNPDYLSFMKDFKVIRFMNMSGITRNKLRHWKDRPYLNQASWGGPEGTRGVPIEIMVELANQLNISPWFNIPHNASDDFIKRFAQYVKKHLKPTLKIHIEYTNEAWNPVFVPQAEHMKQNGTKLKLDRDRRIAGFKFYSQQSVHIFKIWETVFKGSERLIRVMGGMTTDPAMSETILAYKKAYQHVDALAIAPYFYVAQDKLKDITHVDSVFRLLNAADNRYSISNLLKIIRKQSEVTQAYGVNLIAYEGGQHLVDHTSHKLTEGATPHLVAANQDPRMAREYYRLLSGWKSVGGNLFVAFSAPRPHTWHGSWGIKEYINQDTAKTPKYRALLAFNRGEKCWWKGCETSTPVRLPKPNLVPTHLLTGKLPTAKKPKVVMVKRIEKSDGLHKINAQRATNLIKGTIKDYQDLSALWRVGWNTQGLKLWVGIQDERVISDSNQAWADDSIEVYIDANNSREAKYDGQDDFQFTFRMKDSSVSISGNSPQRSLKGVQKKMTKTAKGYRLEAMIPWQLLHVKPQAGLRMGFDIQVNDDDNGHHRDAKISWNAAMDKAWKDPRAFGTLLLEK